MVQKYLTTLNTRPFLYQETKMVAVLLSEKLSVEEIRRQALEENLFMLASKDRSLAFTNEILKRLSGLDEQLVDWFLNSDTQTSKAILLYALLKKDHLFYEWMREVVREKFLILDLKLSKKDSELFIERKGEQSKKIMEWSDSTKKRLINAYHQVLKEVGMLVEGDEGNRLQPLLLEPNVLNYMKENKEKHLIETLLGE